jgi:hypothetical protein
MGRPVYLIVLLGLLPGALAACVPINIDPTRDTFGVSTARPDAGTAAPAAAQLAALNTKGHAICTTGTRTQPPTVQPAQDNQQLVDQKLRCGHWDGPDADFSNIDWTNIL